MNTEKMVNSAREHGMDLDDNPVAYEFYNPTTGHAIVDYTRWTHVGHLREEDGYIARPLVYADGATAREKVKQLTAGRVEPADEPPFAAPAA